MVIVIHGTNHEQVFNASTPEDARDIANRCGLTVELWNRDNPGDLREVYIGEVWPPPAPKQPELPEFVPIPVPEIVKE